MVQLVYHSIVTDARDLGGLHFLFDITQVEKNLEWRSNPSGITVVTPCENATAWLLDMPDLGTDQVVCKPKVSDLIVAAFLNPVPMRLTKKEYRQQDIIDNAAIGKLGFQGIALKHPFKVLVHESLGSYPEARIPILTGIGEVLLGYQHAGMDQGIKEYPNCEMPSDLGIEGVFDIQIDFNSHEVFVINKSVVANGRD